MTTDQGLARPSVRFCLGIAFVAVPTLLFVALYGIWPSGTSTRDHGAELQGFFNTAWSPTLDHRLLLIVIITGALGSYIHAATSYATYVGNSQLHQSWAWWYILRPFIGSALALVFYFVVRGGLLTASGGTEDLNPFGIAAVSGMVGMFSKQAADKLRETFDNLFRTAPGTGDDQRADKLTPANPTIDQISPSELKQGATALTLKITGTNFVPNSLVQVGGSSRATRFISPTSLEAELNATDVQNTSVLQVLVRNPDDVGGLGPPVSFRVT